MTGGEASVPVLIRVFVVDDHVVESRTQAALWAVNHGLVVPSYARETSEEILGRRSTRPARP